MERSLLVHALAFVYLCGVVSLILSCYREENVAKILRETGRRTLKFVGFIAVLAVAAFVFQKVAIDY